MLSEMSNKRLDQTHLSSTSFPGTLSPRMQSKNKGIVARNFSLTTKACDRKILVEFPLDSVRDENVADDFDREDFDDETFPSPKFSKQMTIHKECQDIAKSKTIRETRMFRKAGH